MRKQQYIVQLNHKDEKFLTVLKSSQHISRETALGIVSPNRLRNYQQQGIIKKLHYIEKGVQKTAYELTPKGRTFYRQHYQGSSNFYQSSTAVRHNVRLADEIVRHHNTWVNERDLRQELMEQIERLPPERRFELLSRLERGEISLPDGAYRGEQGELICVEIINSNYGTEQIVAKEAAAEILGASLDFVRH